MSVNASNAVSPDVSGTTAKPRAPSAQQGSLFGPWIDFLGLGGLSLLILPVYMMLPESLRPQLAVTSLVIAHFVNHPHFAHSYQIFYRGFSWKAGSSELPVAFRTRYLFAGVVLPLALAAYLGIHFLRGDAAALGLAGTLMGILVGWHYVKQGYGMLIVQTVLKRQFLNDWQKKALLYNSYACWVFSWCLLNHILDGQTTWGIEHVIVPVSAFWLYLSGAAALVSTAVAMTALVTKAWDKQRPVPWSGIFAYFISLYVWIFVAVIDPLLLLIVPALHSLQYLTVVYRFEANYQKGKETHGFLDTTVFGKTAGRRLAWFVFVGLLGGYIGFWWLPELLEGNVDMSASVLSSGVFFFICWIFINIHHYFIDNVIWRRENPETGKYLFGS